MKVILISIDTYGMKNIEKKLSFHFNNSTISRSYNNKTSTVKAIYGQNGAGKSAIIGSVDLYKKLIFHYSYLTNTIESRILTSLINKKLCEYYIKVIFAIYGDDGLYSDTFAHTLHLKIKQGMPCVDLEQIERLRGKTIDSNWENILTIKNGSVESYLKNTNFEENKLDLYLERTLNVLGGMSSAISIFKNPTYLSQILHLIPKDDENLLLDKYSPVINAILSIEVFGEMLEVSMQKVDNHNPLDNREILKITRLLGKKTTPAKDAFFENLLINEDIVKKNSLQQYIKEVEKLNLFIQVFKPELQNIAVKHKIDGQVYHVSKEFCYDEYSVSEEYESAGIKKLIELFSFLRMSMNGKIVFIDEIDVNINEVVFNKLLEFLINNIRGQLVFTTHNVSSMKVVKKGKNGIDFLTNDNIKISWKSNGNYSPNSQYENGMVPGIPFNIDEFDFYKCLGGE